MLEMVPMQPYPCFLKDINSGKIQTFDHFNDLKTFVGEGRNNFIFGYHRSLKWSMYERESFIGEGKCGGITLQDARQMIQDYIKTQVKLQASGEYYNVYIAWRDHKIDYFEPMNNDLTVSEDLYSLKVQDPNETTVQKVLEYAKEKGLEDSPMLVLFEECGKPDPRLMEFCFPESSLYNKWIGDDLGLLEKELTGMDYVPNDCDWKVTPAWIEYHENALEKQENKCKEMRKVLEKLK